MASMPRPPRGTSARVLSEYRAQVAGRGLAPAPEANIHGNNRHTDGRHGRPSNTPNQLPQASQPMQRGISRRLRSRRTPGAMVEHIPMNSMAPQSIRLVQLRMGWGGYQPASASVNLYSMEPYAVPMLTLSMAELCGILFDRYNTRYSLPGIMDSSPVDAVGVARDVQVNAHIGVAEQYDYVLELCLVVEPREEGSIPDLYLDLNSAVGVFQTRRLPHLRRGLSARSYVNPMAQNPRTDHVMGLRTMLPSDIDYTANVGNTLVHVPAGAMGLRPGQGEGFQFRTSLQDRFPDLENRVSDWDNAVRDVEDEDFEREGF